MKKVTLLAIAAMTAATMMTSCSKDKDNEAGKNDGRVAVQFSANVADVQTRVSDDTFGPHDFVGIYMIKADQPLAAANIFEGADNILYSTPFPYNYMSGGSSPLCPVENTIFYPANGDYVDFISYYPYGEPIDFGLQIDVKDQSDLSAIDVLYARSTGEGAYNKNFSGAVNLQFSHRLAKLVFNISNGSGVTEPVANGITVVISEQRTTGILNLFDGTVFPFGPTSIIKAQGAAIVEAIVLPNETTGVSFTFANNAGEIFTGAVPVPDTHNVWGIGHKYTYNVVLQKGSALEITGTVSPWELGGNYDVVAE
jgi:hypothetical protein